MNKQELFITEMELLVTMMSLMIWKKIHYIKTDEY